MSTIYTSNGFSRYVGGSILELTGEDISTCTYSVVVVNPGALPPAAGWGNPDVSTAGTSTITFENIQVPPTSQRILKLFVSNALGLAAGDHDLYGKIEDAPEREPQFLCRFTTG